MFNRWAITLNSGGFLFYLVKKSFSSCKRINIFICLNQLTKSKLQTGLQLYYKKDAIAAVFKLIFQILTEHLFFTEHFSNEFKSEFSAKKQPTEVFSK